MIEKEKLPHEHLYNCCDNPQPYRFGEKKVGCDNCGYLWDWDD